LYDTIRAWVVWITQSLGKEYKSQRIGANKVEKNDIFLENPKWFNINPSIRISNRIIILSQETINFFKYKLFIGIILSQVTIKFSKINFFMCKNNGKFIVFEKLDWILQ
jgi:hypothetical protein